jgi:hypothetical protein
MSLNDAIADLETELVPGTDPASKIAEIAGEYGINPQALDRAFRARNGDPATWSERRALIRAADVARARARDSEQEGLARQEQDRQEKRVRAREQARRAMERRRADPIHKMRATDRALEMERRRREREREREERIRERARAKTQNVLHNHPDPADFDAVAKRCLAAYLSISNMGMLGSDRVSHDGNSSILRVGRRNIDMSKDRPYDSIFHAVSQDMAETEEMLEDMEDEYAAWIKELSRKDMSDIRKSYPLVEPIYQALRWGRALGRLAQGRSA